MSSATASIVIASLCVACSACCVLIALRITAARRKNGYGNASDSLKNGYEDADGSASPEALVAFSDRLPRFALIVCAFGSFVASVAQIFVRLTHHETVQVVAWLFMVGWLLVLANAAVLQRETSTIARYDIGLLIALSSGVLVAAVAYNAYVSAASWQRNADAVQAILGFTVALASICLPRRPAVSRDGKFVDAQYTVSALAR